ncbi:M14 family metallopeptidase [Luteimonas terricola]|uniref:Peptidase M14 n=1 Tax=Luteimonas terricola TaxID=645597 RepID=A0ABQ2EMY3_9GAMM|nr:M14 family metallopeptidase [Luteimonas terricola]GGK14907.1 peptidase M14 [Luteimonas terricola]
MNHSIDQGPHRRGRSAACASRWLPVAVTLFLAACASTQVLDPVATAAAPPAVATAPTEVSRVAPQVRKTWRFDGDGLRFDNLLPAARLSGVERLGDGSYRVDIAPETHPVNPSAWYGFRVHAEAPRALELRFAYPHNHRHRYVPKLGTGGGEWREAGPGEFQVDAEGRARLWLQLDAGELRVFAQPPLLPGDVEAWSARVVAGMGVEPRTFGTSVQGRPLRAFEFGAGADAPLLLVLGGQHPPENTGTQALMGFVEALAADTPQARAFRDRVRVLVVPLLNPDGVVEGHWRGNANGVDINRDWGPFAQPETRALRDLLAARGFGAGRVAFAIDFHSTFRDVFYTVTEDPSHVPGGVLHAWMAAMQAGFDIEEKPSAARTAVFKNWAFCRLGAPAVTYEVGDATPAAALDEVARHAARSLMAVLLEPPRPMAAPACPQFGEFR